MHWWPRSEPAVHRPRMRRRFGRVHHSPDLLSARGRRPDSCGMRGGPDQIVSTWATSPLPLNDAGTGDVVSEDLSAAAEIVAAALRADVSGRTPEQLST